MDIRKISPKHLKIFTALVMLLVVGGYFLADFIKFSSSETVTPTISANSATAKYPAVSIVDCEAKNLKRVFKSFATLQSWKEVVLRPPLQATIRQILVRVGDPVNIQQTLVHTGSEVQKLKAELEKIDFELKNLDFSVTLALAKKNFLSSKEYRQRELEHKANLIRTKLNQLESSESIQSPIKGVVAELSFKEGEFIDNNSVGLVRVIDSSKLKLPLYIPQDIVSHLKVNDEVLLTRSGTKKNLTAQLLSISPIVDSKTGSVFVEVVVNDVPPGLLPGMFVQVEFTVEKADHALALPAQAVVFEAGQAFVYKIVPLKNRTLASNDDPRELMQVNKLPVKVGLKDGDMIQISQGLEELDQIVVQGLSSLSNGAIVEVIR